MNLRNLGASIRAAFAYPTIERDDLNASLDRLDKVLEKRLADSKTLEAAVKRFGSEL